MSHGRRWWRRPGWIRDFLLFLAVNPAIRGQTCCAGAGRDICKHLMEMDFILPVACIP